MITTIAIYPTERDLFANAKILSAELSLPMIEEDDFQYDYWLLLTQHGLALKKTGDKTKPIFVNFLAKDIQYRAKKVSFKNEALVRALGVKKGDMPIIVDGTGGLGIDSFILTRLGFHIIVLERSPIIYTLLKDGIMRAQLENHIQLHYADANHWLKTNKSPDLIYLDPMFPLKNKTALSKREMQIFHDIIDENNDTETLLETALACATRRVVVKRPRLAPAIALAIQPSFNLIGSSCRFDVYIK